MAKQRYNVGDYVTLSIAINGQAEFLQTLRINMVIIGVKRYIDSDTFGYSLMSPDSVITFAWASEQQLEKTMIGVK